MRAPFALVALVALSAAPAFAAERPAQPTTQTDKSCTWVWTSGGGIGLWTEQCALATGKWAVTYNDSDKRFELKLNGEVVTTVVEVYRKAKDAPVSAILAELKNRGYIPDATECVFKPAEDEATDKRGRSVFEIRPIGSRLKAFEATPKDEVPEPPCGEYGWSTHGRRTFRLDAAHPDAVIYVDEGQDGTMTAPETITFE